MALAAESKLEFLKDALRSYTEDFALLSNKNPFQVWFNGQTFSIHVSSIHAEGRGSSEMDGRRVQVTKSVREKQRQRAKEGEIALFVGLFPDGTVFSAWEPDHVFAQASEKTGSLYAYWSHGQTALNRGGAVKVSFSDNLGRDVHTPSLRSNALGLYLENWKVLHDAASDGELQAIVASVEGALDAAEPGAEIVVEPNADRERVTVTRKTYPRDPKFTQKVLEAYGYACAICSRQLGLVQAAHIIPHNREDCPNDVTNGIALCVEHHKLYDDALLLPAPGGGLHLNLARVEHLQNIGQGEGLDDIEILARNQFNLPDDPAHHPNAEYLQRGVSIRLGLGD